MRQDVPDGSQDVTLSEDDSDSETGRRRFGERDARRLLLDAAHDLVAQAGGLNVSLEGMRLDDVSRHAGLSRSTAYRVWTSKEAFHLDLLKDLAGPSWQGTAAFDQQTIDLASTVVADNLGKLQTPEGRQALMREAVRVAAHRNFEALRESAEWRTYVALTASLLTLTGTDHRRGEEVSAALAESERVFIAKMARFYNNMAVILGFRLKPGLPDFETFAALGAAVVEGLALREAIAADIIGQVVVIDEQDGPREWSMPALGFMAILDAFIELDPDYDPGAALAEYLKRVATAASE